MQSLLEANSYSRNTGAVNIDDLADIQDVIIDISLHKDGALKMKKGLGIKLKKLRNDRNLTIRDVSRLTGLGINTISRWENDKVLPKMRHLSDLAAFYEVGVSYFSDEEYSLELLNHRVGALEKRIQIIEGKIERGWETNEHNPCC